MNTKEIRHLRIIGILEAISYLALLGIAMPLKYFAGMPMAVSIVGMAHGILFLLYCLALAIAWKATRWPFGRVTRYFIASLLPFGPFVVNHSLSDEEAAAGDGQTSSRIGS